MNKNDIEQFSETILAMAEIKGKSLSEPAIDLYFEALKQYTIDEIKKAATRIIQTHKYAVMPSPADFIEFINPPETMIVKAAEAFQEVMDTITRKGIYESVEFEDRSIGHTINALGGWVEFCNYPVAKQFDFFKKEFYNLYSGYCKRGDLSKPEKLIGIIERDNGSEEYMKQLSYRSGDDKPKEIEDKKTIR